MFFSLEKKTQPCDCFVICVLSAIVLVVETDMKNYDKICRRTSSRCSKSYIIIYRDPSLLAKCLGLSGGREKNCLEGRQRSDAVVLRNDLIVSNYKESWSKRCYIIYPCTLHTILA